ncbi:MAG: cytochrome P460 family protein [Pseudobdellovibrionaceae bacterium]|nr:cytochrome P460 family protein [Pseudobdellovibrionaceae bacterium]
MKAVLQKIVLFALFLQNQGCGSDSNDKKPASDAEETNMDVQLGQGAGRFPAALLTDFLAWQPVLEGDQAFTSKGHGGIWVRAYLNPVAAEHAMKNDNPFPMPEGTILAKAVVASNSTPATAATRVYFMKKEAKGFDAANGDWSYGLANLKAGKLTYDSSIKPTQDFCVACHTKFAAYDYVQTVDFFKKQAVN